MKICLSIDPPDVPTARAILRNIPSSIDVVELRIDAMYQPDLDALLRRPRPPVIVTNRCSAEGGGFNGKMEDQYAILSEICEYGPDYVDVEMRWGIPFYKKLADKYPKTRFILSHHDYDGTPEDLLPLYQRMRKASPPIIKIAAMAKSVGDNASVFRMLDQARHDKQSVIGFCMGEYGQPSRILGGKFGAYLTFGYNADGHPTAPGQLSSDALTTVFRANHLMRTTKIFGLVGNPISHSKGIFYHNAVFQREGLNAVYVNFLSESFASFYSTFHGRVAGVSVTMPFKQDAASYVTHFGDESGELGAINTILFRKKKSVGYNTDLAALQALLKKKISLRGKRVIVLGNGGMARTMAYATLRAGAKTTIAGRSAEKSSALAQALGCESTTIGEISNLPCDMLMNGTTVGMNTGKGSEIVPGKFLRQDMVIVEAIDAPEMTPLLVKAQKIGCPFITGREIFQAQAKLQSILFTGSV